MSNLIKGLDAFKEEITEAEARQRYIRYLEDNIERYCNYLKPYAESLLKGVYIETNAAGYCSCLLVDLSKLCIERDKMKAGKS